MTRVARGLRKSHLPHGRRCVRLTIDAAAGIQTGNAQKAHKMKSHIPRSVALAVAFAAMGIFAGSASAQHHGHYGGGFGGGHYGSGFGGGQHSLGYGGIGYGHSGLGIGGIGYSGTGYSGLNGLGYGGIGYSGLGYSSLRLGYGGLGYGGLGYGGLGYGGLGYGGLGYSGLGYGGLGYGGLGYGGIGYGSPLSGYGYDSLSSMRHRDYVSPYSYNVLPPVARYSVQRVPNVQSLRSAPGMRVNPDDENVQLRPGMVLSDGATVISVDPVK